jgi:hypothetical protein
MLWGVVEVYGASDDLIEVEGDIREEFNILGAPEAGSVLAFSNGVVLRVRFGLEGVWRITPVAGASQEKLSIVQAPERDSGNYSDRAFVHDHIEWVVLGSEITHSKQG